MISNTIKKIPNATTATVRIIINAGSDHEEIPGTAHYLEHMIFKGSNLYNNHQIPEKAASLGEINAYTSTDVTLYHMVTTQEKLEDAINFLSNIVFKPVFPKDEFEKERNVILEEFNMTLDNPMHFLYSQVSKKLTDGLAHDTIGYEETIRLISLDDIKKFYEDNYTEKNIHIIVAGDTGELNSKSLNDIISKHFSSNNDSQENEMIKFKSESFGKFEHPDITNLEFPKNQSYATLWFKNLTIKETWDRNFVNNIFSNIVGGGMHSLFFKKIRQEMSLCYSCKLAHSEIGNTSYHLGYAALSEENIDKCINAMKTIIKDVADGNFSDELFEIAKSNNIFGLAEAMQTPEGQCSIILDDYFKFKREMPEFKIENFEYSDYKNKIKKLCKADVQSYASEILSGQFDVVILRGTLKE